MIVNNGRIKELNLETVKAAFTDKEIYNIAAGEIYRPLHILMLSAERALFGLTPKGFHFTNIFLHSVVVFLLYYFLKALTVQSVLAFIAALFFSVHPLNTESVAWIRGSDYLLCNIFYLVSLIFYIKYSKGGRGIFSPFYAISVLCFLFALSSKEMAITLPAILIIYEFTLGERDRKKLFKIIPYLFSALLYLYVRTEVLGQFAQESRYAGHGLMENVYTSLGVVSLYLRLILFPFNQNADYFNFPVMKSILSPYVALSVVLIALLVVAAYMMRRKNPLVTFFIAWFFITLLPVSNVVPIKILAAERFMYLPAIGIIVVASSSMFSLFQLVEKKNKLYILCSIIVILSAMLTISRNRVWSSPEAFWSDALKKDSRNARAHAQLALISLEKGENESAKGHLEKAAGSLLLSSDSFVLLGDKFRSAGDTDSAIKAYRRASYDPRLISVHRNLGLLYYEKGKPDKAINEFEQEIIVNPGDVISLVNLGMLYGMNGRCADAQRIFLQAISVKPEDGRINGMYRQVTSDKCGR